MPPHDGSGNLTRAYAWNALARACAMPFGVAAADARICYVWRIRADGAEFGADRYVRPVDGMDIADAIRARERRHRSRFVHGMTVHVCTG